MSQHRSALTDALPDFSARVVAFYLSQGPAALSGGVVLCDPSFQSLGGRLFVVGSTPQTWERDWCANLPGAVAWDSVLHYVVFASQDDYLKRGQLAPDSWLHRLSHRRARPQR